MKLLNKHGFIEMGFPYYGWLIAIQAGVINMAVKLGIVPNILWGGWRG